MQAVPGRTRARAPRGRFAGSGWRSFSVLANVLLVGLSACRNHDFPEYPASYREFAYVTNGGSNTVSIFDVVHVRLDRELQVGANPTGVTANPKRNEVYVVNSGDRGANGSVSIIDTEKMPSPPTYLSRSSPTSSMSILRETGPTSRTQAPIPFPFWI